MKLVEVNPRTGRVTQHIVRPANAPPLRKLAERETIVTPVPDFRDREFREGRLRDWLRPPSRTRETPGPPQDLGPLEPTPPTTDPTPPEGDPREGKGPTNRP